AEAVSANSRLPNSGPITLLVQFFRDQGMLPNSLLDEEWFQIGIPLTAQSVTRRTSTHMGSGFTAFMSTRGQYARWCAPSVRTCPGASPTTRAAILWLTLISDTEWNMILLWISIWMRRLP